jgi:hypothetical protein
MKAILPHLRTTKVPISVATPGPTSVHIRAHITPLTLIEKLGLFIEIVALYLPIRLQLGRNELRLLHELPRAHLGQPFAAPSEQTAVSALLLGRAVARTLTLLPTHSSCLVRSLVLLRLLARRGVDSSLVIGVHHEDDSFAAHAWVEYRGIPLLDPGGGHFTRILQLDSSGFA